MFSRNQYSFYWNDRLFIIDGDNSRIVMGKNHVGSFYHRLYERIDELNNYTHIASTFMLND